MDSGAWQCVAGTVPYNTAAHLLGPYKVDHVAIKCQVVSTTKTPSAPYRGAGRPEAVFAMERGIDLVAAELELEPAEVRLRNMVRADEMPYRVGLPYRDGHPIVYDSGDYPDGLRKVLSAIGGIEAFRRRQQEARTRRPLSRSRPRRLHGRHRHRAVRRRSGPDRRLRQDRRVGRRLPARSGHGDDLCAGRRGPLVGRRRRCGRPACGLQHHPARLRDDRQPQRHYGLFRDSFRQRAAQGEGLCHRGQSLGMCANGPRAAPRRRRHCRRSRTRADAGASGDGGAARVGRGSARRHRGWS